MVVDLSLPRISSLDVLAFMEYLAQSGISVVKAQSVDGLPSGYVRFLLDLDGKPGSRRHGFEMEGTLTTKECKVMNLNQLGVLYAKTKERYSKTWLNGDNEEFTCSNLKSNNLIPLRNVHVG